MFLSVPMSFYFLSSNKSFLFRNEYYIFYELNISLSLKIPFCNYLKSNFFRILINLLVLSNCLII